MCRGLMDYFAGAEHVLHRLAALPMYDDVESEAASDVGDKLNLDASVSLSSAIEAHARTHANLMNQSESVDAVLILGQQLLSQAHPDAAKRLRQWSHTIRSRWEEVIYAFVMHEMVSSAVVAVLLIFHSKNSFRLSYLPS